MEKNIITIDQITNDKSIISRFLSVWNTKTVKSAKEMIFNDIWGIKGKMKYKIFKTSVSGRIKPKISPKIAICVTPDLNLNLNQEKF